MKFAPYPLIIPDQLKDIILEQHGVELTQPDYITHSELKQAWAHDDRLAELQKVIDKWWVKYDRSRFN